MTDDLNAQQQTTDALRSVVVGLARELYDRYVMGGWEPQDSYELIEDILNPMEIKMANPEPPEPMRHILSLAVAARNEMQGRMADEGHRKAFAALGAIADEARKALGVTIHGSSEP